MNCKCFWIDRTESLVLNGWNWSKWVLKSCYTLTHTMKCTPETEKNKHNIYHFLLFDPSIQYYSEEGTAKNHVIWEWYHKLGRMVWYRRLCLNIFCYRINNNLHASAAFFAEFFHSHSLHIVFVCDFRLYLFTLRFSRLFLWINGTLRINTYLPFCSCCCCYSYCIIRTKKTLKSNRIHLL